MSCDLSETHHEVFLPTGQTGDRREDDVSQVGVCPDVWLCGGVGNCILQAVLESNPTSGQSLRNIICMSYVKYIICCSTVLLVQISVVSGLVVKIQVYIFKKIKTDFDQVEIRQQ